MTDPDYNRRMATALWPGGMIDHPEHPAYGVDYATDWRELPAILAALVKVKRVTTVTLAYCDGVSSAVAWNGGEAIWSVAGDTMLLAAGALLLRLTEEVTK